MDAGGEVGGGLLRAEQGGGAVEFGPVREVEDEGQFDRVGGAEFSVQGAGAPGELVGVGGGPRVGGMGARQRAAARAKRASAMTAERSSAKVASGRDVR